MGKEARQRAPGFFDGRAEFFVEVEPSSFAALERPAALSISLPGSGGA
jgi:hypothetical protein